MPNLTVSPAVDGTWVKLTCPDGSSAYFDNPAQLWHAIVSQPGFFGPAAIGLCPPPEETLDPSRVRPERLRLHAALVRAGHNAASLRKYGIGTSATSGSAPAAQAPAKPTKLRVPKWAQDRLPPADAETGYL